MSFGQWPAGGASGAAIINGVSGAVVRQTGGIFGTFSKPGTGICRVTLTASIAESQDLLAIYVSAADAGGSAADTRIASYSINAGATPPELNIYTRDAAGALADAGRVSLSVSQP